MAAEAKAKSARSRSKSPVTPKRLQRLFRERSRERAAADAECSEALAAWKKAEEKARVEVIELQDKLRIKNAPLKARYDHTYEVYKAYQAGDTYSEKCVLARVEQMIRVAEKTPQTVFVVGVSGSYTENSPFIWERKDVFDRGQLSTKSTLKPVCEAVKLFNQEFEIIDNPIFNFKLLCDDDNTKPYWADNELVIVNKPVISYRDWAIDSKTGTVEWSLRASIPYECRPLSGEDDSDDDEEFKWKKINDTWERLVCVNDAYVYAIARRAKLPRNS
jgi:cytochrome c556